MSHEEPDPLAAYRDILENKDFLRIARDLSVRSKSGIIDQEAIDDFRLVFGRTIKGGEQVLLESTARITAASRVK